jgi:hypothetical protein
MKEIPEEINIDAPFFPHSLFNLALFLNLRDRIREDTSVPPVLQKRIDDFGEDCGLSADRILMKRIIGGDEAKFAQFPWQAFIKIATYQCGGVLGETVSILSIMQF